MTGTSSRHLQSWSAAVPIQCSSPYKCDTVLWDICEIGDAVIWVYSDVRIESGKSGERFIDEASRLVHDVFSECHTAICTMGKKQRAPARTVLLLHVQSSAVCGASKPRQVPGLCS